MNPVHLLDGIHTLDGFKIVCKSGVLGRVLNEAKRTKKIVHSFCTVLEGGNLMPGLERKISKISFYCDLFV